MAPFNQLFTSCILLFLFSFVAPFPVDGRSDAVCSSGIYGELAPILSHYQIAQLFCTAVYPVKCTTVAKRDLHQRAPSTTSATSTSTTTTTTVTTATTKSSTTTTDPKSSAWSKCQQQPWSVISTMCSCIETAKPCTATSTSRTTTTTKSTSTSTMTTTTTSKSTSKTTTKTSSTTTTKSTSSPTTTATTKPPTTTTTATTTTATKASTTTTTTTPTTTTTTTTTTKASTTTTTSPTTTTTSTTTPITTTTTTATSTSTTTTTTTTSSTTSTTSTSTTTSTTTTTTTTSTTTTTTSSLTGTCSIQPAATETAVAAIAPSSPGYGGQFDLYATYFFADSDQNSQILARPGVTTIQNCIDACSKYSGCQGFNFYQGTGTETTYCELYPASDYCFSQSGQFTAGAVTSPGQAQCDESFSPFQAYSSDGQADYLAYSGVYYSTYGPTDMQSQDYSITNFQDCLDSAYNAPNGYYFNFYAGSGGSDSPYCEVFDMGDGGYCLSTSPYWSAGQQQIG